MSEGVLWTSITGKDNIQAHYNKLAAFYKSKQFEKIAALYKDTSVIYAQASGKNYYGPDGAHDFWRSLCYDQDVKDIDFKIKRIRAIKTVAFTPFGGSYKITIQKAGYFGEISYVLRHGDPSRAFSGAGDHLSSCSFDGADFESFPF